MSNQDYVVRLLKSFYKITGVKVVIMDIDFNEIMAYPNDHCDYCKMIRKTQKDKCDKGTIEFCKKSKSIGGLFIGKCHAGLTEVSFPLFHNHLLVGYIMFGQILLKEDDKKKNVQLEENKEYLKDISKRSVEEIEALSDILVSIAHYIMEKQIIKESKDDFKTVFLEYIKNNLDKDLTVESLSKEFAISRSMLYKMTEKYMPQGIAKYVKNVRLDEAKNLLINTDMSVKKIADKVGYNDYNYFGKDFKKTFGISTKKIRQSIKKTVL